MPSLALLLIGEFLRTIVSKYTGLKARQHFPGGSFMKGIGTGLGRLWPGFHQVPECFSTEGGPLSVLLPEHSFPHRSHAVYMNLGESSVSLFCSLPTFKWSQYYWPHSHSRWVSGEVDKNRKVGLGVKAGPDNRAELIRKSRQRPKVSRNWLFRVILVFDWLFIGFF